MNNNDDDYLDWDEPDRDSSTGGSFAIIDAADYVEEEEEPEMDYPEVHAYEERETGYEDDAIPDSAQAEFEDFDQSSDDTSRDELGEDDFVGEGAEWPDDEDGASEDGQRSLPLRLVLVGVIALILLAAGGYGVIKERTDLEEEVRRLQAALATSARPEELDAASDRVEMLQEQNRQLKAELEGLEGDYHLLSGTIADLQAQLKQQREKEQRAAAAPVPATSTTSRPAVPQVTAAPVTGGDWFVNFSSYGQRETAENWSKRLRPTTGEVIVAAAEAGGETLYRVRVVGLADKEEASRVARQLEQDHGVTNLWVGRQP